jgi:hypothetical protein
MPYQNMWLISRAEFNTHIRLTLLQLWMFPSTPGTSHNSLKNTYALFSDSLIEPRSMGQFFACLFELLEALPQAILQGPNLYEYYNNDLLAVTDTVAEKLPDGLGTTLDTPRELNNLVVETLREFFSDPSDEAWAVEAEQDRVELLTTAEFGPERLEQLGAYAWPVTLICFYVVIDVFLPLFRARWTDEQFDDFIKGLEFALPDDDLITAFLLENPGLEQIDYGEYYLPEGITEPWNEEFEFEELQIEDLVGDSESEESEIEDLVGENGVEFDPVDAQYIPAGQPIPLGNFCQPIASPVGFDDVDCNICGNGVTVIEAGDEAVVTLCMHYFHASCLTSWVNDSAADNSNSCPHCRTRMCERRARTLVGFEGDDDDNSQDEDANDDAQDEDANDDAQDEDVNDDAQDEDAGPGDEDTGSGDGDDGFEDRWTALREYIMQYRAAVSPVVSAAVTA